MLETRAVCVLSSPMQPRARTSARRSRTARRPLTAPSEGIRLLSESAGRSRGDVHTRALRGDVHTRALREDVHTRALRSHVVARQEGVMRGQRHTTAVGSAGVRGAPPVVALVAGLVVALVAVLAAAPVASAAPGDRVWVRSIASSSLAEDFVDVAKGQQRTVYAAGYARATEESGRLLVARYTADGTRLWARTYAAGGDGAYGRCLLVVPGGVIVAGTAGNVASPGRRDIVVVRYTGDGRRVWALRYDGPGHRDDSAEGLALGPDGTFFLGGTSPGKGTGRDYAVMRVRLSDGARLWTRRYDGPGSSDRLMAIHAGPGSEGVYVTGESADEGGGTAAATIRYSFTGRRLWVRRLHGGAGSAFGTAVNIALTEGAVFVVGGSEGGMSTGWDMMLARLSLATGAVEWAHFAAVPNGDEYSAGTAFHVPLAAGYGIAAAGYTVERGTGTVRGLVAAWTYDGVQRWQDEFAASLPTDDALFFCVTHDPSGNVYCGGITSRLAGSTDVAAVKYSPAGARLWASSYDSAAHATDFCHAVAYGHGGLFVAGLREKTMLDTSALLIRYEP